MLLFGKVKNICVCHGEASANALAKRQHFDWRYRLGWMTTRVQHGTRCTQSPFCLPKHVTLVHGYTGLRSKILTASMLFYCRRTQGLAQETDARLS